MSTLIEDVTTRLRTLGATGGVWYALNTSSEPTFPYITFQRIASNPNVSLQGPSDLQETRFQIDIFSTKLSEVVALETALEASMASWSVQNVPLLSQDMYEDAVDAFRTSKDYSIWATN